MATPSILVINDKSLYIEMVKDLLIDEGYPQVRSIGGARAFDAVRQERPSLVVLDINSAQAGEGWQMLDRLRLHPATTQVPVIVCLSDAYALPTKAAWLDQLRCDTLEAPFDLDDLLARVCAIVGPPP